MIKADDRIIVALDVDNFEKMITMAMRLGDSVSFAKVGMELFYSAGNETVLFLRASGKKVFLDLKFHDIPNTVAASVATLTRLGASVLSLHAAGGRAMLSAAAESAKAAAEKYGVERPRLVAITALTSFDEVGWQEIGGQLPIRDHVLKLAELAQSSGVDGVVASPREAEIIRDLCGPDFLIITPGIRPASAEINDQKRIATPSEALRLGASQLVIGRPITAAENPRQAVKQILAEIKNVESSRVR